MSLRLVITGPQSGKRTVRETLRGYAEEDTELCGQRIETLVLPLPAENDAQGCHAIGDALAHENAVLLFVADMTGDYVEALARLATLPAIPAHVPIEVLLHKADRLPQAEGFAVLAAIGRRFRRLSSQRSALPASAQQPLAISSLEGKVASLSVPHEQRNISRDAALARQPVHSSAVSIPPYPRRPTESSGGESWDAGLRTASDSLHADAIAAVQWSPDSLSGQEMHFQLASTHDRTLLISAGNILQRHAAAAPALEALADRLRSARRGSYRLLLMDRRSAACVAWDTLGVDGRATGLGLLSAVSGISAHGHSATHGDDIFFVAAIEAVDAACDLAAMFSSDWQSCFSMRYVLPATRSEQRRLFVDADDLGNDIVAVCVHDGTEDASYVDALAAARSMTLPQIAAARNGRPFSAVCGGMRA